tara:strand:- start:5633 stop:6370 length:738 start_codon:yes stop_codon:yes gene_type:complete
MKKILAEIQNLSLIYKNKNILDNINFKIYEGDKIALIGTNGSGKSSLISVLNGTIKTINGEIKIFDKSIDQLGNKQKINIGTIWQDLRLIDELSAEQNVNCGLLGRENFLFALKNLLNICTFEKAHKCMKLFLLNENLFEKNIEKLSGGEKQRIAIARSIIQEPNILFADEPFNNLDPKISIYIKNLLISRKNNFNIKIPHTQLISLHRLDLLRGFNKVIGIKNGRMVFKLNTNQLKDYHLKKIY